MVSKVVLPSNVPIADEKGNPTPFFTRQLKLLLDEKQDVADAAAAAQATADAAVPTDALLAELLTAFGGDPNEDILLFWDDSAGTFKFLSLGANLSITDTTLNAAGGGGGSDLLGYAYVNNKVTLASNVTSSGGLITGLTTSITLAANTTVEWHFSILIGRTSGMVRIHPTVDGVITPTPPDTNGFFFSIPTGAVNIQEANGTLIFPVTAGTHTFQLNYSDANTINTQDFMQRMMTIRSIA